MTNPKRIPTILFILVSLSQLVFSQNKSMIQGQVIDAVSKSPLIMANVALLGTTLGASTDNEGKFSIENVPVGTWRVQVTYIGYEPTVKTDIMVISARPAYVNIALNPVILQSEGLSISAGYFVEEERVQSSTIGLSREEIRRFPGGFEDVVRTVSTLPGVAINSAGGRNDLLVRGGGPSENLYIINNIEVPNINHFGTQGSSSGSLSFVNLDFVEDVSFSTGGFPARYGNKMSSVLTLQLSDEKPNRFQGKATLSATQYGADVNIPLKGKGNMIFSARKSYLDLIFKAANLPFVPVYTDYNFLLNYDITDKDKLFVLGLSAVNNIDRDQSTLENRVSNAALLDNTQYQGISGINYRRLLNHGYLDFTLGQTLFRYRFDQLDENESTWFSSDSDEWETSLKLQHYWILNQSVGFKSGLSTQFIRLDTQTIFADSVYDRSGNKLPVSALGMPQQFLFDKSTGKSSAFLEADWSLHPKVDINVGLRADHYNFIAKSDYVSPRASVKIQPSARYNFRFSGGFYYQPPSYVWTANQINQHLRALKNQMGVIAYDYLLREDMRLSVEVYYKKYSQLPTGTLPGISDHIVMTNTGTGYGGREDNFQSFGYFPLVSDGTGRAYGAEFLLQKKFSDIPLYGLATLTYGKSEVTAGNGKTYPGQYDQRFITNLSGGYIFNAKWEIAAKFRYFTGVPHSPVYRPALNPVNPGSISNIPEEYLAGRTDAGHHLDIRIDRYFNFSSWTCIVYLDIQNVYNVKIPQKPAYDFWNDSIENSSAIGILPSLGISASF